MRTQPCLPNFGKRCDIKNNRNIIDPKQQIYSPCFHIPLLEAKHISEVFIISHFPVHNIPGLILKYDSAACTHSEQTVNQIDCRGQTRGGYSRSIQGQTVAE